jgi:AcrR family transcriptional regulator
MRTDEGPAEVVAGRGRAAGSVSARVARNRRRRSDEFLAAALAIVVDHGFEALTMARLATVLDTAIGSVYRYYASKDHLLAAVQASAVESIAASYDATVPELVQAVRAAAADDPPALVELVVVGRWFCAVADALPEEVRLLQMVSARRSSALGPGGGEALMPTVMAFLGRIVGAIDAATEAGDLRPGSPLARAIMWLTAFGGVLEADDLEKYLPDVLGGARLARQLNCDLVAGWGADPDVVDRIDQAIDAVAAEMPLVRQPEG